MAVATLVSVSIVAVAAGCASNGSTNASSSGAGAQRQAGTQAKDAAGVAPVAPAQGGNAAKPGAGAPAQLAVDSRALIFTGTVTIQVTDVGRAASDVSGLATAAGGFVGGDERTSDKDRAQARLTLRVPSARFTSVVEGVSKLGKDGRDESRQLSTQDVTDQVTDVDARIATGQASVDRVRDLLSRAQTIGEIVSLESELSRREADLESLKSRKRTLDDQTTLSTITAVLLGPPTGKAAPDQSDTGFLAGLAAGWRSFTASVRVLLTVLGALLPWLIALGVPALAVLWWLRRARRSRAEPASAPAE
ncbi:lipoprotein [Planosporangium mesophilum]|uniref:Lipoprotein n=1 Tax=Planosporangium mesophilum TaxID=689768 RepID=A0A8J3WZ28_9ACTN|nr:lipoprotein [Planosporangium mesophilum]